jgi:C1A family cysteine protease
MALNSRQKRVAKRLASVIAVAIPMTMLFATGQPGASAGPSETPEQKLARLQKQFSDPKYKFKLAITDVATLQLQGVSGNELPADLQTTASQDNQRAQTWLDEEKKNLGPKAVNVPAGCDIAPKYDLRAVGLSSPVKPSQGNCNSCWDFAAMAAFESSWKKVNGTDILASEQHLLNCAPAVGTCWGGGIYTSAFLHLRFRAIPSQTDVPYTGAAHACNIEPATPYSASIYGWVHPLGLKPSIHQMKAALCEHGAIAASIYASEAFHFYAGGIFNAMENDKRTNHAIAVIGWDDAKHAWLIKNSWGPKWGENGDDPKSTNGYGWIDYDSNGIGDGAAWVLARKACADEGDYDAGLCYSKCKPGFHGIGPMCWANCPNGMIDEGATCRAPISSIAKKSEPRGAGQPMICKPGEEQNGALCYPACRSGFTGVGPVCWKPCPEGYRDDGATCRKDAVVRAKTSYGRGAGGPLTCAPGEEQNGGLCYPACRDGFRGVGPVCWGTCPSGYHDDGATCRRDAHVVGSDNSKCPWYDKCGLAGARGCSKCPDGYHNDGCACRVDAHVFGKPSYGRGAGRPLSSCSASSERDGALCYPRCQSGYKGVGPVCWAACPEGFHDDGATCRKDAQIVGKESYGRSAGNPLSACRPGQERDGALCYAACPANMTGVGPVCWEKCPADHHDDGAFCTKGGNVIAAPGSYGRGLGKIPP